MKRHGHVLPDPRGRMRCGGPGLCASCSDELRAITEDSQEELTIIAESDRTPRLARHLAKIILKLKKESK